MTLITFPEDAVLDETLSVTVAVWVSVPLIPVIVITELPVGVPADVAIISVEPAPAATDGGLKLPEAPVGKPLMVRLTVPLKPFRLAVLIEYDVPLPCVTEALTGVADRLKSGLDVCCPNGTIWMAFNGARGVPSEAVPGVAVKVKPAALIGKTT